MEAGDLGLFPAARRRPLFLLVCLFCWSLTPGCFFTSAAGIRPHGAIKGYEVREQIKRVVSVNVFIGALGFCSERSHLTDFDCGRLISTDTIFAAERAASLALLLVKLDNETFYTPGSVKSCLSTMAIRTLFFTDAYLSGEADCSRTTNTCSLDRKAVRTGATRAAILAAPACSLRPTGLLISLENTTL